jgi:hypothetical protein
VVKHSEQINELATALAKAQAKIEGATKDKTNPHFRSSYADLASVWDACRSALTSNGLSVSQTAGASEDGRVRVTTILMHSSGQWLCDDLGMKPVKDDPQGVGSCITYARRYALAAIVGVAPEDDDGNAASLPQKTTISVAPAGYGDWRDDLAAVAEQGTDALQKAWKESKAEYRAYLTSTNAEAWEALKKLAAGKKAA